jgi:hypothetical protein
MCHAFLPIVASARQSEHVSYNSKIGEHLKVSGFPGSLPLQDAIVSIKNH